MDTVNPLVSVLMSVYNEDTVLINEAIESIINQSFKDFEFIIIGDNPINDRVINIIKDFSRKDKRISFYVNETNIGLTKSLNRGLRLCRGKYVVRMDADDISLPNRIKEQVAFMEKNTQVVAAGANVILIDETGKEIGKSDVYLKDIDIKTSLIFQSSLIHPATILRRVIDGKVWCYDEYYKYSQDYALWVSFLDYRLGNIHEVLLKYRISSSQITSSKRDEQLNYTKQIQEKALNYYGLKLNSGEADILFRLACNNKSLSKEDDECVNKFVRNFIKHSIINLNNESRRVCKKWVVNYYIRYITNNPTNWYNTVQKYLIFGLSTKNLNFSSFMLLVKLLITSK